MSSSASKTVKIVRLVMDDLRKRKGILDDVDAVVQMEMEIELTNLIYDELEYGAE